MLKMFMTHESIRCWLFVDFMVGNPQINSGTHDNSNFTAIGTWPLFRWKIWFVLWEINTNRLNTRLMSNKHITRRTCNEFFFFLTKYSASFLFSKLKYTYPPQFPSTFRKKQKSSLMNHFKISLFFGQQNNVDQTLAFMKTFEYTFMKSMKTIVNFVHNLEM